MSLARVRSAAFQRLLASEQAGALWKLEVLGYPVWPLARLQCYRHELLQGDVAERSGPGVPLRDRVDRQRVPLAQSLRDVIRQRGFPPERDIWVLSTSPYRRRDARGELQCIFALDLERQFGDRLLYLERNTNGLAMPYRSDVRHIDAAHLAAMAAAKAAAIVASRRVVLGAEQARAFAPFDAEGLCRLALYGRLMEQAAERWIRAVRPSAVFVLCAYQPFIPIQRVVRSHGIPLIELQHGVIHENHPGYILDGAPELPHLPDHIVLFGRYFGEMLDRESPHFRDRWSVGGHRWLAAAATRAPASNAARRSILFFSQDDPPVRRLIMDTVRSLAPLLPSALRIVVKPHPREEDAATYWRSLQSERVTIASHLDDGYALLREAAASVCVYSTVALEALAFGCASIVLRSPLWTEDIGVLVQQGVLQVADTATDLFELLLHEDAFAQREALREALFGLQAPALDYGRLIDDLSARAISRHESSRTPGTSDHARRR